MSLIKVKPSVLDISVRDISKLPKTASVGDSINVNSFYSGIEGAGGVFVWAAEAKNTHNGGTIIDPTHTLIAAPGTPGWWTAAADATLGVWKRVYDGPIYDTWFGVKPDNNSLSSTINALAIQAIIEFLKTNDTTVFLPSGTRYIDRGLIFDRADAESYVFPFLQKDVFVGEKGTVIKAAPSFAYASTDDTMLYMGTLGGAQYGGSLHLKNIVVDGGNQTIKLIGANETLGQQARFYADDCEFVGVTGANSIAINSAGFSAWLNNCILQGSGTHTENGVGVVARYTTVKLNNCFVQYFGKAIRYLAHPEATVAAKNTLFQTNAVNVSYQGSADGGTTPMTHNNASFFDNCYFVETNATNGSDIHFDVELGTGGILPLTTFTACQFDRFSSTATDDLFDLTLNGFAVFFTFINCNYWATSSYGLNALYNVTLGSETRANFIDCNFVVDTDNVYNYAKFEDWKATTTPAGGSSAGLQYRDFSTTVINKISSCTNSGNRFTLAVPGVYRIRASAPSYAAGAHRLLLQQDPDGTPSYIGYGTNESSSSTMTRSTVEARVVVPVGGLTFGLNHFITNAVATHGLGINVDDGLPEVYTQVEIWKEA